MIRIVFFGNSASEFTARHFQALIEAPCLLSGVVDLPAKKRDTTNALPAGLPNFVDSARESGVPVFEPHNPNDLDFVNALGRLQPDLFISAGYALILKKAILGIPRIMAANFHASLLPDYRGKHPVFWALRAGERRVGLTVHVMDAGIDTGDILYQVKVRTRWNDSVASLYDRIMQRSSGLVGKLIADAERGSLTRHPQPKSGGSYYSSATEQDFRIDWQWEAERVSRYINATPGKCFQDIRNQRLFFTGAKAVSAQNSRPAGTLLRLGRKYATIAAGKGVVSLAAIHPLEGKLISASQILREMGLSPGDMLV